MLIPTDNEQALTLKKLERYNTDILIPKLKDIMKDVVDERMRHYTNEILESNDKVIKKLVDEETERAAISANYSDVDDRVRNLETFAKHVSPKVGVAFPTHLSTS